MSDPVAGREPLAVAEAEYWTAAEVGTLTKLSGKTWYRLAASDPSLPCIRIGGSLRFPKARLLAWLKSREQGAGKPRRLAVVKDAGGAR